MKKMMSWAAVALVCAGLAHATGCSSDEKAVTGDTGGDGGDTGTGGSSTVQTTSSSCEAFCDKTLEACSDADEALCLADCEAALDLCDSETETFLACTEDADFSDPACVGDGAYPDDCLVEALAVESCVQDIGGGGAGAGGESAGGAGGAGGAG